MEHFVEWLNKNQKLTELGVMIGKHFIKIAIILGAAYFAVKAIHFFSAQILKYAEQKHSSSGEVKQRTDYEKRLATIVKLIDTTARVVLFAFAILMVLKEIGFDITPLLTGAGIAGVAVGFGAQSLVKDVISGVFILLENQIQIGDSVKIAGVGGVVEGLDLRTITLRDVDGTVHIIPNGEIRAVSNQSYDFGVALVNIPCPYSADVARLVQVIEKTVQEFESDAHFTRLVLGRLEFSGITGFNSQHMELRLSVKTRPSSKVFIERTLRQKILQDLQTAKISVGI